MTRILPVLFLAALLAALLAGCTVTFGPGGGTEFTPNPPNNQMGGWFDGTGPRGASGGGP